MPKMKTHSGAKRRFKVSAGGKLMRTKGPKSHLRRRKSKRVRRLFGGTVEQGSKALVRRIKTVLMPYSG